MKILKNKKGITLIELIVGIVMFGVITVAISTMLAPMLFSFMSANDFAEYNSLLDNLANQMINDLSQATEAPVFVPSTASADGWAEDETGLPDGAGLTIKTRNRIVRYRVNDAGVLQRAGVIEVFDDDDGRRVTEVVWFEVFDADIYKRKAVSFMLTLDDESDFTSYILTIRIASTHDVPSAGGNFELQRDYAVRPLMLN